METGPSTDEGGSALSRAAQRREQLREVMGAFERAIAAPLPGRVDDWWAEVGRVLAELRSTWERHVDGTEGPDGLFAEVMAHAPRMAHSVDKLRREHVATGEALAALAARVPPVSGDDREGEAFGETVRQEGVDLLARLVHHRHLGADLLHEAYTVDVTAGD